MSVQLPGGGRIPDPIAAAGTVWVLGQLLLLAAVGTGIIRTVWPQITPNIAWSAGLLVGPALFAAVTALGMYAFPGVPGVVVGWVVSLVFGAVVTRRLALRTLWPGWQVVGVWLAIFVVALAARQQYWIPDANSHAPLSASLMAGVFPPRFPSTPDLPAIYHFLPELAIGALNLGFGPGLVLTTEILGAFVAAGFAVLVMAVARDLDASRLAMAVALPLLLSPGLWTLVLYVDRPAAVQIAIPVGVPEAGLRAALASLYVPDISAPATSPVEAAPPNIINPHFIWSHGLALTAALLATVRARHALTSTLIFALVISALSGIDETVFVALLLGLSGYVAVGVLRDRSHWQRQVSLVMGLVAGAGLAVVQGGVLSDLIFHAPAGVDVVTLRAPAPQPAWLGGVKSIGGGLGAVTLGTVAMLVASAAAAYRVKSAALAILVAMALALFAGFALIHYPASPADTARLEGHAISLSAVALAVGLAAAATRLRHRAALYGGVLVVAGLMVWPTTTDSVGRIAEPIADGPRLYVAGTRGEPTGSFSSRSPLDAEIEQRQALLDAISAAAAPGQRILTAQVMVVTVGTGQPAPLGYAEWPHNLGLHGPEYQDALRFLDRAALNELGIEFIHVDEAMRSVMSDDAKRRLATPAEFQLIFQSAGPHRDALYAVIPPTGDSREPDPASFRAFADLAAGRRVLISSAVHPLARLPLFYTLRSSSSLFGHWGDPGHFRRDVRIQPPAGTSVDLVVLPDTLYPSPLDPAHRTPAWTANRTRVYDLTASVAGQAPRPPIGVDGPSILSSSGIEVTSLPEWSEAWTGTDWVLYREAEPGSGVPAMLERGERWYPGQLAPKNPGQRVTIRFDGSRGQLEYLGADGGWSAVGDARGALPDGSYVLTLRFWTHGRPAYFVPVAVMALGVDAPEDKVLTLQGS